MVKSYKRDVSYINGSTAFTEIKLLLAVANNSVSVINHLHRYNTSSKNTFAAYAEIWNSKIYPEFNDGNRCHQSSFKKQYLFNIHKQHTVSDNKKQMSTKQSALSTASSAVHLQIEAHPNSIGGNQHFACICRIIENSSLCKLRAWKHSTCKTHTRYLNKSLPDRCTELLT